MTRGSSAQPSVLPNSLAENPVGASYDDVAEAGPAFCSSKVPEVPPPQSTEPHIRVGAPDFSEPHLAVAMGHFTINLRKFWENDVSLWFLMVENIFSMRKIDSECQRHELLLSSLDLRHLQRVEHVLLDLDPVFPYSYLKVAPIKTFGQTEEHKLDQLLHACELGDRKPTELLAEVRKLLGTKGSPVLLKKLFMDRLLSSMKRVLVAGPIDNLDDLARRADRVFAEDRSSTSEPRFVAAPDKLLVEKVDQLAKSFNSFLQQCPAPQTVTLQANSFAPIPMASTNQNGNFQRPSFSRPRFSSTPYRGPRRGRFSPSPRPPLGDLCFYHSRFGGDAFHCISPCARRSPIARRPENTDATFPKNELLIQAL